MGKKKQAKEQEKLLALCTKLTEKNDLLSTLDYLKTPLPKTEWDTVNSMLGYESNELLNEPAFQPEDEKVEIDGGDSVTTRGSILTTARRLTEGDRNQAYGPPYLNLSNIAGLWSAYLCEKYRGVVLDEVALRLTAEDVAHLNVLQKMARTFQPNYHADSYCDMAAYSAIAAECRLEEDAE